MVRDGTSYTRMERRSDALILHLIGVCRARARGASGSAGTRHTRCACAAAAAASTCRRAPAPPAATPQPASASVRSPNAYPHPKFGSLVFVRFGCGSDGIKPWLCLA
jgi:hypothetical protein